MKTTSEIWLKYIGETMADSQLIFLLINIIQIALLFAIVVQLSVLISNTNKK